MALIIQQLQTALADLLKKPINDAPAETWTGTQKADALLSAETAALNMATAITDHIKTADVLNVKTANDTGVYPVEAYTLGVGTNAGVLSTAMGPVIGVINAGVLPTATQTNKGSLE